MATSNDRKEPGVKMHGIRIDTCVSWYVSHRSTGVHLHSVMNRTVQSAWGCCGAAVSCSDRLIAQWSHGEPGWAAGTAPSEAKRPQGQKGCWVSI